MTNYTGNGLKGIVSRYNEGIITAREMVEDVKAYDRDHFGLGFRLEDIMNYAEGMDISINEDEARKIADTLEEETTTSEGIHWLGIAHQIKRFDEERVTQYKNITMTLVITKGDLVESDVDQLQGRLAQLAKELEGLGYKAMTILDPEEK